MLESLDQAVLESGGFMRVVLLFGAALGILGCGGSPAPDEPAEPPIENARPTVFDPLTSTIDRAQGVQQTVDEQAAELRRRVDEAEK
jgi:hypothetical protein